MKGNKKIKENKQSTKKQISLPATETRAACVTQRGENSVFFSRLFIYALSLFCAKIAGVMRLCLCSRTEEAARY